MTHRRGLLDTSVVIEGWGTAASWLPAEGFVASLTVAELAAGPLATANPVEAAVRQERLQQVEATFEPLPFDVAAARASVPIYAAVLAAGRRPRGRIVDLYIAAVALANGLPLYTRHPDDFRGLERLVTVVAV